MIYVLYVTTLFLYCKYVIQNFSIGRTLETQLSNYFILLLRKQVKFLNNEHRTGQCQAVWSLGILAQVSITFRGLLEKFSLKMITWPPSVLVYFFVSLFFGFFFLSLFFPYRLICLSSVQVIFSGYYLNSNYAVGLKGRSEI